MSEFSDGEMQAMLREFRPLAEPAGSAILADVSAEVARAGRLFVPVTGSAASRVAYADPPYIGQAKKHYSHDPRCAEVDHAKLIEHLNTFDAWALSCSSPSLKQILAMCPDDVCVMAWVKPFCAFKVNVRGEIGEGGSENN